MISICNSRTLLTLTIGHRFWFCLIVLLITSSVDFTQATRSYTDQSLDTWEPPSEIKKSFPYYFTGRDYDGQAVFVMEFGKWPIRKMIEDASEERKQDMDKYVEQMLYTWHKIVSAYTNSTETGLYGIIVDMDGYNAHEVAHIPTLNFGLKSIAQRFTNDFSKDLDYAFLINVNYIAQTVIETLARPILAETFTKIEIFGTNKDKWIPKLLRKIPHKSLPEWYGGSKDFKPVAVYGK